MPENDSYIFTHKQTLVALVKAAGLHEGRWQLAMTFGLAAMNMGPNEEDVSPGATVAVTGVGLLRAQPDSPPTLVVDASIVNPASE
jgi:hypothetical protein